MIVRGICEKYHKLPNEVEELSLDQIFLLVVDEKRLEKLGERRQTTINQLQQEGVIPFTGGGSLVQRIRAQNAANRLLALKAGKRQRRRERREALIEYKRQQEQ